QRDHVAVVHVMSIIVATDPWRGRPAVPYFLRIASVGAWLAPQKAGNAAPLTPMRMATKTPCTITYGAIRPWIRPEVTWKPLRNLVSPIAAKVPTAAPPTLRKIDSQKMIDITRRLVQPIARKVPISRTRSATDITMVLSIPIAPITIAIAETAHATPRASLI